MFSSTPPDGCRSLELRFEMVGQTMLSCILALCFVLPRCTLAATLVDSNLGESVVQVNSASGMMRRETPPGLPAVAHQGHDAFRPRSAQLQQKEGSRLAPAPAAVPAPPPPLTDKEREKSYLYWLQSRAGSALALELSLNMLESMQPGSAELDTVRSALKRIVFETASEGDPSVVPSDVEVTMLPETSSAHVVLDLHKDANTMNILVTLTKAVNAKSMTARLQTQEGMGRFMLKGFAVHDVSTLSFAANTRMECVPGARPVADLYSLGVTTFETCRSSCSNRIPWAKDVRPYASFQFGSKKGQFNDQIKAECNCIMKSSMQQLSQDATNSTGDSMICGALACQPGSYSESHPGVDKITTIVEQSSHSLLGCRRACAGYPGFQMSDIRAPFMDSVEAECACLTSVASRPMLPQFNLAKVPITCATLGEAANAADYMFRNPELVAKAAEDGLKASSGTTPSAANNVSDDTAVSSVGQQAVGIITGLEGDALNAALVPLIGGMTLFTDRTKQKAPVSLPEEFNDVQVLKMPVSKTGTFGFTATKDLMVFVVLRCSRANSGDADEKTLTKPSVSELKEQGFAETSIGFAVDGTQCDASFNGGKSHVLQRQITKDNVLNVKISQKTNYHVFVKDAKKTGKAKLMR